MPAVDGGAAIKRGAQFVQLAPAHQRSDAEIAPAASLAVDLQQALARRGHPERPGIDVSVDGATVLLKARQLAGDSGIAAEAHCVEITSGRVASVILSKARELGCDLVVMGTHGRRGLSRSLLGSDAEQVLCSSGVPVLLVRQPEGVP